MKNKKQNDEKKVEVVEERVEKRTDYVLAIFLIFLGSVLLLNTTGVIEWNIWSVLWRFWPLLIVFAGLSLIFEGSRILSIIIALFAVLFLSFVFLWSANLIETPNWFERVVEDEVDATSSHVVSAVEFADIERKNINVEMGIGSLYVVNENSDDHLLLDAEYFSNLGKPILKTDVVEDILNVELELGKGQSSFFWRGARTPKYLLNLGSDEISTDFSLNLGAGQGEILLNDYNLRNLTIKTGAGDARTNLTDMLINELTVEVGAGNFNLNLVGEIEIVEVINVEVGVGKLTLNLPEGAEYRLDANVGIGSIRTPDENISGLGQDAVVIESDDYELAERKFRIVAEVGIGELVIK
jgi:hypothetical protein